jgi:hypothetical protein
VRAGDLHLAPARARYIIEPDAMVKWLAPNGDFAGELQVTSRSHFLR